LSVVGRTYDAVADNNRQLASTLMFTPRTLAFLRSLKRHNDRAWFASHREEYEAHVRAPMVALVGTSGAGKSTLVSLLLGFISPTAGRIRVGGVDLTDVDPAAWRRRIAYVPQRPTLFRGTVADNIRLGEQTADEDRVRRAAELAGAHDFVSSLPRGYETLVGESERQLSTGERRRIALARAFLRDAPLVLLDEPTADLDPARVALVSAAIERLRPGHTVLLVAHRPEVALQADRIVRLADGRIAAPVEVA
jgi:ABC-type multidrug transport system fused ATPase/permease subunit